MAVAVPETGLPVALEPLCHSSESLATRDCLQTVLMLSGLHKQICNQHMS